MGPGDLAHVLRHLPKNVVDANLLVGLDTSDDAGVYKLGSDLALVQTVDFFTPIVDNPYDFGAIAAANALSDVYAMGAIPVTVMNLAAFPVGILDFGVLAEILRGGSDKIAESGATLVGGHTIDDPEPKYGLAVTGVVHPDKVVKNSTCRPGDQIVLTKPIGVGIINTAIKAGLATEQHIKQATETMSELNDRAALAMTEIGVNACTDITGFGLIGHLLEMARASHVSIRLRSKSVPVLGGAHEFAEGGVVPGGSWDNLRYFSEWVTFSDDVSETERLILCDAMTSGGLAIAVCEAKAGALLDSLKSKGVSAALIGHAAAGSGRLEVVP